MRGNFQKAIHHYRQQGGLSLLKRVGFELFQSTVMSAIDSSSQHSQFHRTLLRESEINICRGEFATEQFTDGMKNIFLAIESPAVVRNQEWYDASLNFDAEISFGNFYGLEQYYCPRDLYATFDYFVKNLPEKKYSDKNQLTSLIYSNKQIYSGHQLRHRTANVYGEYLDLYGSGAGRYVENKIESLANYMFQVVIENDKHPDYVSEKFFDCLKTNTIPIYWGGEKSIRELGFNTEGVLFFDSIEDLDHILNSVVSEQTYHNLRPIAEENRKRLIEIRNNARFNQYSRSVHLQFAYDEDETNHHNLWLEGS